MSKFKLRLLAFGFLEVGCGDKLCDFTLEVVLIAKSVSSKEGSLRRGIVGDLAADLLEEVGDCHLESTSTISSSFCEEFNI